MDESTTQELERLRERMPCDGGCDYNSGPEETCSLHGRTPRDIWEAVATVQAQRDAALADGWDEGVQAACEAVPGSVWFDGWSDLRNPYRTADRGGAL